MQSDHWDPKQYNKFRRQRLQPYEDLLALIRSRVGMHVIDLGCGTGEITALLAEHLPNAVVEGIDSSPAMLQEARIHAGERVTFRLQEMQEIGDFSRYDLVFSNAALHWVQDTETFLARILEQLRPGAQVAVQVPNNYGHPSHLIAAELAQEPPFRHLLGGFVHSRYVLPLERYAEMLYDHGFRQQVCLEKIYGHELSGSSEVVEWVKGTLLTSYLGRLDERGQADFLEAYRKRLLAALGDRRPYYYPYRRLLFWGEKTFCDPRP